VDESEVCIGCQLDTQFQCYLAYFSLSSLKETQNYSVRLCISILQWSFALTYKV
jgi:hypothetical protein